VKYPAIFESLVVVPLPKVCMESISRLQFRESCVPLRGGGKPLAVHPKRFIDCNYVQVRWSRAGGGREKRGKRDESRRARGGKWNEKKGDDGLTDGRRLRAERAFPRASRAHPFAGCWSSLFSQVSPIRLFSEKRSRNIAN